MNVISPDHETPRTTEQIVEDSLIEKRENENRSLHQLLKKHGYTGDFEGKAMEEWLVENDFRLVKDSHTSMNGTMRVEQISYTLCRKEDAISFSFVVDLA